RSCTIRCREVAAAQQRGVHRGEVAGLDDVPVGVERAASVWRRLTGHSQSAEAETAAAQRDHPDQRGRLYAGERSHASDEVTAESGSGCFRVCAEREIEFGELHA